MHLSSTQSTIQDVNARFYNVDLSKSYIESGKKFAEVLQLRYGKNKSYSIVCGLGGNAGDGLSTALELSKNNTHVKVFLVGRANLIESDSTKAIWDKVYNSKSIQIKQDCYAKDIEKSDIILECLVGTGLVGATLNKRFFDVIKSVSHFKSEIVAIDTPCPHYIPNLVISINYPKTENAEVIKVSYPQSLDLHIGPGEIKSLVKPKMQSHKNKNGKVLIINDLDNDCNELIATAVKQYECSSSVYSFRGISKSKLFDKVLSNGDLEEAIVECNSVFLSELPVDDFISKAFVNELVKYIEDKPLIIFGSALNYFDYELLKRIKNKILIFDLTSFFKFSNSKISKVEGLAARLAKETSSTCVIYSTQTYIFDEEGNYKIHPKNINEYNSKLVTSSLTAAYASKNSTALSAGSANFVYSVAEKLSEDPSPTNVAKSLSAAYNECLEF